ncbi:MAG: carboxypeptidase-like regulatory domain-containing protein [Bacteroidota bacterium]
MKPFLLFALFFSISISCFAQKYTLRGTIYDEDKNALAFANVIVKNTMQGVITNDEGQFTIDVTPKDMLEVSYLGFETKEIQITDQKNMSVMLETTHEVMDTVEIVAYSRTCVKSRIACTLFSYTNSCGAPTISSKNESSEFKRIQGEQRLNSLFPNPSANGIFQLQLNDKYTDLTLEVFNMNGQLLQTNTFTKLSKNPQIDLSNQSRGMYLIRIVADGKLLETKKAIRS